MIYNDSNSPIWRFTQISATLEKYILTNALSRLFSLTSPNLEFLELSDKNWSSIHKYWPTDEFLGSMERLKYVLSAEEVFKPEK